MVSVRARGVVIAVVATAGIAAAPRSVTAQIRTASLDYQRGEGADDCPDEQAIRDAVVARLGADPFATTAAVHIRVEVTGGPAGYRADVAVRDGERDAGNRELRAGRRCDELIGAVGLVVAMVVDPGAPTRPQSPLPLEAPDLPGAVEPPAPQRRDLERPPPTQFDAEIAAARPPASGGGAELAVCAGAHAGVLPRSGTSLGAQLMLRRGGAAGLAEAAWLPPASVGLAGGRVSGELWQAALGGCRLAGRLGVCALASLGVLRGRGQEYPTRAAVMVPHAAATLRLSWERALGPRSALRVQVDGSVALLRPRLVVTGEPSGAWTAPALSAGAGLALVSRFP